MADYWFVTAYKNTNFGNNDLVWNIPNSKYYNFSTHENEIFPDVKIRFPMLTTKITLYGNYTLDTKYFDYMIIKNATTQESLYYFINSVIAERNILIFSVTMDVISSYKLLEQPISGTIIRKHDTNYNETRFDYPTALNFEGNFTNEIYDTITYNPIATRFIESAIKLTAVENAVSIPSNGNAITVPKLPVPSHKTEYVIRSWSGEETPDNTRAYTLYLTDNIDQGVLNTVRGLSGDGAISDSYSVPSEAITVVSTNSEVTKVTGRFLTKTSAMKLEIDFSQYDWSPNNPAIEGMFTVTIMSMQDKGKMSFPAWDLKNSVDDNNFIKVNLWCDPKPSGAPYCCPDQVETIDPYVTGGIINLATLEIKSARGGQWLRSPLLYTTGSGEIFSTIETALQRKKADYEKNVAFQQLEISRREREIKIAQQDYNYQSGIVSSLIGGGMALSGKDIAGAAGQAKNIFDSTVNQKYVEQMRDLQAFEQETEKQLIKMAYSNNLNNLNTQEAIRRVVPRETAFQGNESLGSYESYNGFIVKISVPDIQSLKAKDMEYTLYGYPVFETVENFKMIDHLRTKYTVYQFDNPIIAIGGTAGNMIREVLKGGIRIFTQHYTNDNMTYNPKYD